MATLLLLLTSGSISLLAGLYFAAAAGLLPQAKFLTAKVARKELVVEGDGASTEAPTLQPPPVPAQFAQQEEAEPELVSPFPAAIVMEPPPTIPVQTNLESEEEEPELISPFPMGAVMQPPPIPDAKTAVVPEVVQQQAEPGPKVESGPPAIDPGWTLSQKLEVLDEAIVQAGGGLLLTFVHTTPFLAEGLQQTGKTTICKIIYHLRHLSLLEQGQAHGLIVTTPHGPKKDSWPALPWIRVYRAWDDIKWVCKTYWYEQLKNPDRVSFHFDEIIQYPGQGIDINSVILSAIAESQGHNSQAAFVAHGTSNIFTQADGFADALKQHAQIHTAFELVGLKGERRPSSNLTLSGAIYDQMNGNAATGKTRYPVTKPAWLTEEWLFQNFAKELGVDRMGQSAPESRPEPVSISFDTPAPSAPQLPVQTVVATPVVTVEQPPPLASVTDIQTKMQAKMQAKMQGMQERVQQGTALNVNVATATAHPVGATSYSSSTTINNTTINNGLSTEQLTALLDQCQAGNVTFDPQRSAQPEELALLEYVLRIKEQHQMKKVDIIQMLYGAQPGGNKAYAAASTRYDQIQARLGESA